MNKKKSHLDNKSQVKLVKITKFIYLKDPYFLIKKSTLIFHEESGWRKVSEKKDKENEYKTRNGMTTYNFN